MIRPAFGKAGGIHRADMTACPAGDPQYMPFPQIAESNVMFRSEHLGLKLMALGRGQISKSDNVPVMFSLLIGHIPLSASSRYRTALAKRQSPERAGRQSR